MIRSHNIDWDYIVKTAETASFNISKYQAGDIIGLDPASATGDITITLDAAYARDRKPGPMRFVIVSATTTNQIVIAQNSLCYTFAADLTLGSATEDLVGHVFELTSDGTKWAYGEQATAYTVPTVTTITGANLISALDPGIYAVNNAAAVTVDLDAKAVGEWEFVILKTTAVAAFFTVTDGISGGLASPGTSYQFGDTDIEEKGLHVKIIGTGVAVADGFSISDSPEPDDLIGETLTGSTDISTLKAGYVYPVAHTAACSLTIGAIATQGMWRFEIAASTDTAAAGFAITLDGARLATGVDVVFGGADDEQLGRVFRVISDGTSAYVDYVAKDKVGAAIVTGAVDVAADCEAGVIYPLGAFTGPVTLNLTTKTAGIYKFQIIGTTMHATDFPTVTGGADLYDGSASKVLGGVGPIADFIGQTFTLTCDGTKWSYGSPKKPLYLEDNTVLTSDGTDTKITSFATNGLSVLDSAGADAPVHAASIGDTGATTSYTTDTGVLVDAAGVGLNVNLVNGTVADAAGSSCSIDLTAGTITDSTGTGMSIDCGAGILTDNAGAGMSLDLLAGTIADTGAVVCSIDVSAGTLIDTAGAGASVDLASGTIADTGAAVCSMDFAAGTITDTAGAGLSVDLAAGTIADTGAAVLSVDWSAGTLSDNGGTGCSIDLAAGTLTDTAATVCSIDLAAGTLTDTVGTGTTIDLVAGTLTDNGGTGVTIDIPSGTLTDSGGTGVTIDVAAGTLTDNGAAGCSIDLPAGTITDTGAAVCSIDLAAGTLTDTAGAGASIDLPAGTIGDTGATVLSMDFAAGTITDTAGTGMSADFAAGTLADTAAAVCSIDLSAGTLSDNGGTGCSIDLAAGTLTDTAATVCSIDLAAGTLTDTAGAGTTIDLVAGTLTDNGGTGVTIDIPAGTLTDNGGTGVSVDLLAGTLTDNAGAGLSLDLLSGTIKDTAVGTAINIDAAGTIDVSGQVTVGTLSDGTASITGGDLATVGAVGCDSVTATGAVEGLSVTDGTATMTTGALDGVTSLSSAQVKQPAVTETAGGAITSFPPGAVSLIDNSAGPVTIAFPTAPATGAIWHLGIKSDTSGANTVTLATDSSGGDLVSGMSGDVVICGARNYAGSSFSIFTDGAKYYCSRFGDASFGDVYGDAATFSAGVAVTGALTATTHTTVPQTFLEDSGAPTADDHNGTMAHRVIKATYDYSINGEGLGTHAIGLDAAGTGAEAIVIPAGSMIKKTYLYVETAFTSAGAATVAFQIAGANDVITQTAFDDGLFTVSTCAEGAQDGAPANMGVLAGTVSIVIGTADLTAGRVHLFIEYMTAT